MSEWINERVREKGGEREIENCVRKSYIWTCSKLQYNTQPPTHPLKWWNVEMLKWRRIHVQNSTAYLSLASLGEISYFQHNDKNYNPICTKPSGHSITRFLSFSLFFSPIYSFIHSCDGKSANCLSCMFSCKIDRQRWGSIRSK